VGKNQRRKVYIEINKRTHGKKGGGYVEKEEEET
jgi:hypothetical protein